MKTKEPKTLEQLNDVERKVYDLCKLDEVCTNSNTLLCIKFWQFYAKSESEQKAIKEQEIELDADEMLKPSIVEQYQPESITRARRHLVEWGLLIPKKEIQKKRMEIEASYHAPDYIKHTRIVWKNGVPYQEAY